MTFQSGGTIFSGFCANGRETVYGGGISPLGLKANILRHRRFQPFGAVSVGFISSVRPIPLDIPGEGKFNFTFDFQVGVERFNAAHARSWRFGLKLEHISNDHIIDPDPGVDAILIHFGYSFFK